MATMGDTIVRDLPFGLSARNAPTGLDGLTLEGYAAVFRSPTLINNSTEGRFIEQIEPGAFTASLRQLTPMLQYDHGKHPLVGSIPIGSFTDIREDAHGLWVSARLHDNWMVQPVRDAIDSRSISGMSFRFRVVRDRWDIAPDGEQRRTLLEVTCFECGPVAWPAYGGTSVDVRRAEKAPRRSSATVRRARAAAIARRMGWT